MADAFHSPAARLLSPPCPSCSTVPTSRSVTCRARRKSQSRAPSPKQQAHRHRAASTCRGQARADWRPCPFFPLLLRCCLCGPSRSRFEFPHTLLSRHCLSFHCHRLTPCLACRCVVVVFSEGEKVQKLRARNASLSSLVPSRSRSRSVAEMRRRGGNNSMTHTPLVSVFYV